MAWRRSRPGERAPGDGSAVGRGCSARVRLRARGAAGLGRAWSQLGRRASVSAGPVFQHPCRARARIAVFFATRAGPGPCLSS